MLSAVLIIPAALREKANALAEAMGWGPNNYSVPLSVGGTDPATHYGLHSWVGPEFVDLLAAADRGQMPAPLAAAGYPSDHFAAVVGTLNASILESSDGHFADVCRVMDILPISQEA